MIDGVHARDDCEQNLRSADVARRLLAADVLLARLERHAQRRLSIGVARDADDASRDMALELVARREESSVRSAISERNSEALRVSDDDVGAPFSRRHEQRQRKQIGRDRDKRLGRVRLLARHRGSR